MATLYKIVLSGVNEKATISVHDGQKIVDREVSLHDIETEMLEACVGLASTREKDIRKYMLCKDLYSQVKGLTKDAPELTDLTMDDIAIIKAGFSLSAEMQGGRPFKWMRAMNLIEQLINPKEKNEQSKKE